MDGYYYDNIDNIANICLYHIWNALISAFPLVCHSTLHPRRPNLQQHDIVFILQFGILHVSPKVMWFHKFTFNWPGLHKLLAVRPRCWSVRGRFACCQWWTDDTRFETAPKNCSIANWIAFFSCLLLLCWCHWRHDWNHGCGLHSVILGTYCILCWPQIFIIYCGVACWCVRFVKECFLLAALL